MTSIPQRDPTAGPLWDPPREPGDRADDEPVPLRLVALGASNLTRALRPLVTAVAERGGPVEAMAACGHGRSFGAWSALGGLRALPGIVECGLWTALDARPAARRTIALLADAGNDVAYGAPVPAITSWLEACVRRLARENAKMVVVLPPVASVAKLPPWRFALARTLLFPGRALDQGAVTDALAQLAEALRLLAGAHGATIVTPAPEWFGVDPIHPHRDGRRALRAQILDAWQLAPTDSGTRYQRTRAGWWPRIAAHGRLLGRPWHRSQPCERFAGGGSLSLY